MSLHTTKLQPMPWTITLNIEPNNSNYPISTHDDYDQACEALDELRLQCLAKGYLIPCYGIDLFSAVTEDGTQITYGIEQE